MTKLEKLKTDGLTRCQARGHTMTKGAVNRNKTLWNAHCIDCLAGVWVTTRLLPFETSHFHGKALEVDCEGKK